jgi:hypothetical protein
MSEISKWGLQGTLFKVNWGVSKTIPTAHENSSSELEGY